MSAIDRANEDESRGDLGSARRRLMSHVAAQGYDQSICRRIATLALRMHDPHEAARWFLISDPADPDATEPIAQFLAACNHDAHQLRAQLPLIQRLDHTEHLPAEVMRVLKLHGIDLPPPEVRPEPAPRTTLRQRLAAILVTLAFISIPLLALIGIGTVISWFVRR